MTKVGSMTGIDHIVKTDSDGYLTEIDLSMDKKQRKKLQQRKIRGGEFQRKQQRKFQEQQLT